LCGEGGWVRVYDAQSRESQPVKPHLLLPICFRSWADLPGLDPKCLRNLARPRGVEPLTPRSVVRGWVIGENLNPPEAANKPLGILRKIV